MTLPTHGPSTPGDADPYERRGLAATRPSGSETPAPEPPRPVFQRPAGYDTLSPASPYTVVFEPWPDTSAARQTAGAVSETVPPVQPADEPPLSAAGGQVPAVGTPELSRPGGDVAGDLPGEPQVLASVEATQSYPAASQSSEPAPQPAFSATQASAPVPEAYASATAAYASATAAYAPATAAYAPATAAYAPPGEAYAPTVQELGPSFVPTAQPYGGTARPQPFPASANPEPDPYLALLRGKVAPPQFGSARPRTENVGRGLGMALIAVLGGCVLSAFVYHLGFVASIVAFAMGATGIVLYAKGAGAPPRKGAVALIVLLVAGILLAWVSSVGTELFFYYVDRKGTSDGAILFVLRSVLSLDLFTAMLKDFLIFVGFGVLGIFGVARQLLARRAR
ncbi:MAG TPA: hypothetical protein VFK68_01585 [Propionibacteriaceae bacterium]|nr:hypothetical protein [Propionibacteriaceae bacterium]